MSKRFEALDRTGVKRILRPVVVGMLILAMLVGCTYAEGIVSWGHMGEPLRSRFAADRPNGSNSSTIKVSIENTSSYRGISSDMKAFIKYTNHDLAGINADSGYDIDDHGCRGMEGRDMCSVTITRTQSDSYIKCGYYGKTRVEIITDAWRKVHGCR